MHSSSRWWALLNQLDGCVGGENGEPSNPIPIQKLPCARMRALGDSARLNAYGTMLGLGVEERNKHDGARRVERRRLRYPGFARGGPKARMDAPRLNPRSHVVRATTPYSGARIGAHGDLLSVATISPCAQADGADNRTYGQTKLGQ